MKFLAHIDIMPLNALLDPQGKAVTNSMKNIGLTTIENVRIGKHITLEVNASNETDAMAITEDACKKLLCNMIMEEFTVKITSV